MEMVPVVGERWTEVNGSCHEYVQAQFQLNMDTLTSHSHTHTHTHTHTHVFSRTHTHSTHQTKHSILALQSDLYTLWNVITSMHRYTNAQINCYNEELCQGTHTERGQRQNIMHKQTQAFLCYQICRLVQCM